MADHPEFFSRRPDLQPPKATGAPADTVRTLRAFGDEWRRFPDLTGVHEAIFRWYFEGLEPQGWRALRALDAGCGMGRWLHFARQAGCRVVGMDLSAAVDVAAAREGSDADFVQADLRQPPFADASFDLVYSLGVLHHLERPLEGLRALARLVRPGGELRFYVYRTLDEEPRWKRLLLAGVSGLRRLTTRLPFPAVHLVALTIGIAATVFFLWPRRMFRRWPLGDRLSRGLPLVHYADVPLKMLVAEQFDRLVAPLEQRFRERDLEGWIQAIGFEVVAIMPGLGWRVTCRRPSSQESPATGVTRDARSD